MFEAYCESSIPKIRRFHNLLLFLSGPSYPIIRKTTVVSSKDHTFEKGSSITHNFHHRLIGKIISPLTEEQLDWGNTTTKSLSGQKLKSELLYSRIIKRGRNLELSQNIIFAIIKFILRHKIETLGFYQIQTTTLRTVCKSIIFLNQVITNHIYVIKRIFYNNNPFMVAEPCF